MTSIVCTFPRRFKLAAGATALTLALMLSVQSAHAQTPATPPMTDEQIEAISGKYGPLNVYDEELKKGTLSVENYEKLVAIREQAGAHIEEMVKRDFARAGLNDDSIVRIMHGRTDDLIDAVKAKDGAAAADAMTGTLRDGLNQLALPTNTEMTIITDALLDTTRDLVTARAAMPNPDLKTTAIILAVLDDAQRSLAGKLYNDRIALEKTGDALANMPAAEKAEMVARIQKAIDKGDLKASGGHLLISDDLAAQMDAAKVASNGSSRNGKGSVKNGNGTVQPPASAAAGNGTSGGNAVSGRNTGAGNNSSQANGGAGRSTANGGDPALTATATGGNANVSGNGSPGVATTTSGAQSSGTGTGYTSGGDSNGSERPILYVTTSTNGIPDSIPAVVDGKWQLVNNPASPRWSGGPQGYNGQGADNGRPAGYLVDGDQPRDADDFNVLVAQANAISATANSIISLNDAGDASPTSVALAPIYAGYRVQSGQGGSSVIQVTSTAVQTPTAVMTVPSSQIALGTTQVNVPSTQVNMPSPVMTSLDLYPALCGS